MLEIQEMTVLVICVIKVSTLTNPGLPPRGFLQTKQLMILVVFFILQNPRGGNCLLLPLTGYAHADV